MRAAVVDDEVSGQTEIAGQAFGREEGVRCIWYDVNGMFWNLCSLEIQRPAAQEVVFLHLMIVEDLAADREKLADMICQDCAKHRESVDFIARLPHTRKGRWG